MRRVMFLSALVATAPVAAQGQDSAWGYFEPDNGPIQAGVQASNGAQLILKCDKRGKGEVYAVVVSPEPLVPPTNQDFTMRPIELRFDSEATVQERWRFYERSAIAVNKGSERTLQRLLADMSDAQRLVVRMNPERARWVEADFPVSGAKEAIGRVFESCGDQSPLG